MRFNIGLGLLIAGCLIGIVLNLALFVLPALSSPMFGKLLGVMGKMAIVAYIPVVLYLFVPWFIDRYDPEPWWALLGCFLWGALFATGVSGWINTIIGQVSGSRFVASAISAPIFEELTKGMAIFGMAYFLRREFDGVVDGIIYATFVAIGFAATENIIYYTRSYNNLGGIFILRGILTPWLHPFFTAMIGIGFGMARTRPETWAKFVFPAGGYFLAVFFHAWWNGMPQLLGSGMVVINMVIGILMALTFGIIVCVLVWQKGKTIKKFLRDEVLVGTITQEEFNLITSYGGRLRARLSWRGAAGAEFVQAGARLALSKWHTTNAMKGQKKTISADFIVPLRQDLARLRNQMNAHGRR